jgi:hypothetical protein
MEKHKSPVYSFICHTPSSRVSQGLRVSHGANVTPIGPCPSLNFELHVINHNDGVQQPMLMASCRPSVFNLHMQSLLFHAQIQFSVAFTHFTSNGIFVTLINRLM